MCFLMMSCGRGGLIRRACIVRRHQYRDSHDPAVGYDRYLDAELWFPQEMGILGVQRYVPCPLPPTVLRDPHSHTLRFTVFFGLFQAPYYAFSQTMMSELCPPGFENMFFGLFGLSNRASSIIGPNVIQAIIDNANGNNWMGFPFLFALAAAASIVIAFGVNVEKGRKDAVEFARDRRVTLADGARAEDEATGSHVGSDLKID